MRKLTHEELLARQQKRQDGNKYPICVILNNIRSLYNVGSIFRTADGAGIEKIWICGITGHPPKNQISKTALGAEESVEWEYCPQVTDALKTVKSQGYKILFLEQIEQSIAYEDYEPEGPVCLVLGNEIEGISDEVLSYCDQAVEIDMDGLKNSLNVSVAFGVIAFHLRHKFKERNITVNK